MGTVVPITQGRRRGQKTAIDPARVTELYGQGRSLKSRFHDLWWTCHGFYDGRQYQTWRYGNPVDTKAPSWRVRMRLNRIAPIVQTAVAKLTQHRPKTLAKPRGIDPERIARAKATQHLLDYLDEPAGFQDADEEVAFWMAVAGNGARAAEWDEERGHEFSIEPEGGERATILTGFPRVVSVQPFDLFYDAAATTERDARYLIRQHRMTRDAVEERWPKSYGKIADAERRGSTQWDGSPYGDYGDESWRPDVTGLTGDDQTIARRIRVLEYQEIPSLAESQGLRGFVAEGINLEESELPFRRFNVFHSRFHRVGGRFWGRGIVEDLLDLQRELNRTVSQIVEIRNLHLHPIWLNPSKAMKADALVNKPDTILNYNAHVGAKPERVDPPPLPPSLESLVQRFENDMEAISGIHGVSQGRTESGVVSGRAMATIADQDETKLGPAVKSNARARLACAAYVRDMWKAYMPAPVTLTVIGPSRIPETIELYASDLDDCDLELIEGSATPTHPSVERDYALQVFAQGGFEDTEAAVRLREATGVAGVQSIEGDDSAAALYAEEENTWLLGEDDQIAAQVDVGWPDDDMVHIRRHLRAYNSRRYRTVAPIVQTRLRQHLAKHYQMAALKAQGQPVYAEELGQGIPALEQPQTQPQATLMSPAEETPAGMGGGTPELNAATGPEVAPAGPGANPHEEMTGTY